MKYSKQYMVHLVVIFAAALVCVPFIENIGIAHCYVTLPFFRKILLGVVIGLGLFVLFSWILRSILKIFWSSFFNADGDKTNMPG